mgnify:CR=1 FL=1
MNKIEKKILKELRENNRVSRLDFLFKHFIFPWQLNKSLRALWDKGYLISCIKLSDPNYKLIRDKNDEF